MNKNELRIDALPKRIQILCDRYFCFEVHPELEDGWIVVDFRDDGWYDGCNHLPDSEHRMTAERMREIVAHYVDDSPQYTLRLRPKTFPDWQDWTVSLAEGALE